MQVKKYTLNKYLKKYDVVIVGGGISGLSSLISLYKKGLKVLLVEKSAFLGGRAFSFKDNSTDEIIDNGQHVIVGACNEFVKLIKDVGNVPTSDMKRSFNLGLGMVMIIKKENITKAETYLKEKKEPYCILGEVA